MKSLDEWLAYQQHLHAVGIDLGLERVREVWRRMGAQRPAPVVITVGGTNGKGSTVALLDALLRAGGMRVGAFTSPHIQRYNERVRIADLEATDATLVDAFARIEAVRGTISLTYFEFGTLAALDTFARAQLDVALLEVGMGGRLDAVNIIDADCAVVVTVDLDHMQYLGPDRESIGREKAGIFRPERPAIVGEADPPASVTRHALAIGARLEILGRDFGWRRRAGAREWWHRTGSAMDAAVPNAGVPEVVLRDGELSLEGTFQYRNAATAVAALHALGDRVRWNAAGLRQPAVGGGLGLMAGRLQHLLARPDVVIDVGHNPQAARGLAAWLDAHAVPGRVLAVYGALADKDVGAVVSALGDRIDRWYLGGLDADSPRGESIVRLSTRVREALPGASIVACGDITAALRAARADAGPDDRILAFGSFHVVAPVLLEMRHV